MIAINVWVFLIMCFFTGMGATLGVYAVIDSILGRYR